MTLIRLIQYGTPVILLGLLITVARLVDGVKSLRGSIEKIEEGVIWKGECAAMHGGVDARLGRLEREANNH